MATTRSFLAESAVKIGRAPWRAVAWIVVLAAVARVAAVAATADLRTTEYEYGYIANSLLAGHGYSWAWDGMDRQPTSLFPPGYVAWVAVFRGLFGGDHVAMYVVQALVAATGCLPAFLLGRLVWGPLAGLGFALGYAIYPELVLVPSVAVPEFVHVILALWMLVVCFDGLAKAVPGVWWRRALPLGGLAGAAILVRESAALVAFACGLRWMLSARSGRSDLARAAVLAGLTSVAIVAPWTVRNWIVQGEFIPVRTGYGYNLWLGNHPGATGTNWGVDGRYMIDTVDPEYRRDLLARLPSDEQDRDRAYRDEIRQVVRDDPWRYVRLTFDRLRYLLWFDPTYPLGSHPLYRSGYLLLLATALPGIVIAARARRFDAVFWWIVVGHLVLYVPVMVVPRYRLLTNTLLLLFSAVWLVRVSAGEPDPASPGSVAPGLQPRRGA